MSYQYSHRVAPTAAPVVSTNAVMAHKKIMEKHGCKIKSGYEVKFWYSQLYQLKKPI